MLSWNHSCRRWVAVPVLGAGAAAVVLAGRAAHASAEPGSSATTTLENQQTGYCLDSDNPGARPPLENVYSLPCNGGDNQKWVVTAVSNGSPIVTLTNVKTGLCLTGNSRDPMEPAVGAVYTASCGGTASQQWSLTGTGNGQILLQNVATGLQLDSNYQDTIGANPGTGDVYAHDPNGGTYQQWNTPNGLPQFRATAIPVWAARSQG